LDAVARQNPSVIVLDMRMPVMDGWTFARELEARAIRLPIIVITAAQNARHWAEEIRADAYLPKPFDLNDLLETVERLGALPAYPGKVSSACLVTPWVGHRVAGRLVRRPFLFAMRRGRGGGRAAALLVWKPRTEVAPPRWARKQPGGATSVRDAQDGGRA